MRRSKVCLLRLLKRLGIVLQGQIKVMQLDLADLASVKRFSKAYLVEECGPDLLILNAGVMACPQSYTKDGFEMQIGKVHTMCNALMVTAAACILGDIMLH